MVLMNAGYYLFSAPNEKYLDWFSSGTNINDTTRTYLFTHDLIMLAYNYRKMK